jgi:tetratricopeptide (TPR) repeat protein/tRNA A-37 threonylcarbamoyl transferase component Bud32
LSLGGRRGLAGVLSSMFGADEMPEHFGRYAIGARLGAGAFGEVYEAFDAKLRRGVALKLFKHSAAATQLERLRREARAMAAVGHPALVEVFEVGHAYGRDFIAMELVRGSTLEAWAEANPPGTRARFDRALRLLTQAAQGLAAAHARGLVHRDFKPANVLVGPDEAAKVADFGLARAERADTRRAADAESTRDGQTAPHAIDELDPTMPTLTRSGAIMGTPRYMSPEQHRGDRADARSDQFSFAVAAWEVIHGQPPFGGRTPLALLESIERGRLAGSPTAGVPGWVTPILRRALSPRAEDRFASMLDLLDALSSASRRRRRRVAAAGALLAVAALLWWGRAGAGGDGGPQCDEREARRELTQVWNPSRRSAVEAALRATGVPYVDATMRSLDASLEGYGARFTAQRVAACRATWEQRTSSEAQLDQRVGCLRDGLATTDALLGRLESASKELAERVLRAADGLPDPVACEHAESIPAEEVSAAAGPIRGQLAAAKAAHLAGDYAGAEAQAMSAADRARAEGLEGLLGQALYTAGVAGNERTVGGGNARLEEAFAVATSLDQSQEAARRAWAAAIGRANAGELQAADRWLRHGAAALARTSSPSDELVGSLTRAECALRKSQGRYDDALAACREAVKVLARAGTVAESTGWSARQTLATVLIDMGQIDEARALLLVLRDEAIARWGASHPQVGGTWMNLGRAASEDGDLDAAVDDYAQATAIFRVAYGPDHRWVVSALMNLATAELQRLDFAASRAALEQALEAAGPRRDAATARVLLNLSEVARHEGKHEEALGLLTRVSDIESEVLPPDHPQTAYTHHARAVMLVELRRLDEARAEIERVIALRAGSPSAPDTGLAYGVLARIDELQGRADDAIEHATAAERIFAKITVPAGDRAPNLLLLSEQLLARGEPDRARVYAKIAAELATPTLPAHLTRRLDAITAKLAMPSPTPAAAPAPAK